MDHSRNPGEMQDKIDAHRRGEPIPPRIINEDRLFDIENARELIHDAY